MKTFCFTVVVLAIFTFVGCGDDNVAETSNPPQPEAVSVQATPTPEPTPATDMVAIYNFVNDEKNVRRFTSYRKSGDGAIQVTFYHKGRRYTIYFSGQNGDSGLNKRSFISYWVGSKDMPKVTFTSDFRGRVTFGIMAGDNIRPDHKFRDDSLIDPGRPVVGEEHREYWQEHLDHAIYSTLDYIGRDDLIPLNLF